MIEFKRADLGPHQELLFLAVDPQNTVSRIVALPDDKSDYLDLRLAKGLDPKLHFMQQQRVTYVPAKGSLVIADITSARFEVVRQSAPGVHAVLGLEQRSKAGGVQLHPQLAGAQAARRSRRCIANTPATSCTSFSIRRTPSSSSGRSGLTWRTRRKSNSSIIGCLEDDLGEYLKPWQFEHLNTFERILVGPAHPRRAGDHGKIDQGPGRSAAARSRPDQPPVRNGDQRQLAGDERRAWPTRSAGKAEDIEQAQRA